MVPSPLPSGDLVGSGAGLLWTTQGAIMMTYPRENDKGKFIGHFWAIFNAGAVLGSAIAFIINKDVAVAASLSDSIYAAFISIMLIGTLTAFPLAPPSSVTHSNGDRIPLQ